MTVESASHDARKWQSPVTLTGLANLCYSVLQTVFLEIHLPPSPSHLPPSPPPTPQTGLVQPRTRLCDVGPKSPEPVVDGDGHCPRLSAGHKGEDSSCCLRRVSVMFLQQRESQFTAQRFLSRGCQPCQFARSLQSF